MDIPIEIYVIIFTFFTLIYSFESENKKTRLFLNLCTIIMLLGFITTEIEHSILDIFYVALLVTCILNMLIIAEKIN